MSIPLTLDWLMLAWFELRLRRCLRGLAGPGLGRSLARQLALLPVLALFSGCVPVTRFEETQSAAQVELDGRRRAEYQVAQLQLQNAELRGRLSQQGTAIDERDQALAQAELDGTTQGKQKDDAEGMVEQLRGELARVGGHLQNYHDDKQKLATELEAAAARGRAMSRLSRDVALALTEPIATGEYVLDAERTRIVLRVPRENVLADDGTVKTEAEPLLKAVALLLQLHKATALRVEDTSAQSDPLAVSGILAALRERSVADDRFEPLAAPADESQTPVPAGPEPVGAPQIVLGFSVP